MINRKLLPFILIFFAAPCFGEDYTLSKKEMITLHVSNYVHGFKEFDTSVVAYDNSVSVGIYYDYDTQSKDRAEQLADRFRKQIPGMINKYGWGKDIDVVVNIWGEDRSGRGY